MDKETVSISVSVVVLLVFILYVYIQSWMSFREKGNNQFNENLYQYRKTLYVLFVLVIGMLLLMQTISIEDNWKLLMMLAGMIVFIDIFVFSTPTIKKIWKTEFQAYDPLKQYIQENSLIEEKQKDKLNYFSQLVQIAPFLKNDIAKKRLDIADSLALFLSYYADHFGLRVHLYNVGEKHKITSDVDHLFSEFGETLQAIKHTHTLDWCTMPSNITKEDEDAERTVVETLWNGDIIALDREDKHGKGIAHLCPIFVGEDIFVLFIEEIHQQVYEMDALFLTNLACLYCFLEHEEKACPFVKNQ
ncbi:hypothetical protein J416_06033 [Gracilibacillus halophilus YIM-C55.5]|uniref:Uncharacterized protein n=1 Tax=Gracilibacillus halophilus YIM-C55.5 TaxID=1308866 RepID=N4WN46_9BACI|nr:type II toxin-antitoxin system SpoIISA family toxin [Gracilibacillus halophilus]ENH97547.1 hypothetical protein J416_06033 [Gracilibacillus halophilus YIM-C55.5]